MAKKNYFLNIIQAAVANNDFEFDPEDSIIDVFTAAEESLLENPVGKKFVRTELNGHGMSQSYTFWDEDSDYHTTMSGEIFDFGHYKAESEVYFREVGDDEFEPVSWFEIPSPGEPGRDKYIFVFDVEVLSDGRIAYLYDYFG